VRRGLLSQPASVAGNYRGSVQSRSRTAILREWLNVLQGARSSARHDGNIISRLLNREIQIDMRQRLHPKVPPSARMEGFDLVTEGTLTLGEVLRLLEEGFAPEEMESNPAVRLAAMLLDSDIVKFAVGTRINEAHQDPNIPVELDLRRNIVKRIAQLLESKHMKRVVIQYL